MMQATPAIRRRFANPSVVVFMVNIPRLRKRVEPNEKQYWKPRCPESLSMLLAARRNLYAQLFCRHFPEGHNRENGKCDESGMGRDESGALGTNRAN
jgi:hypothetical protein